MKRQRTLGMKLIGIWLSFCLTVRATFVEVVKNRFQLVILILQILLFLFTIWAMFEMLHLLRILLR